MRYKPDQLIRAHNKEKDWNIGSVEDKLRTENTKATLNKHGYDNGMQALSPKIFLFKSKCGLGKCISTSDYKINNRTRRETVISMPVAGHI